MASYDRNFSSLNFTLRGLPRDGGPAAVLLSRRYIPPLVLRGPRVKQFRLGEYVTQSGSRGTRTIDGLYLAGYAVIHNRKPRHDAGRRKTLVIFV